VTEIISVDIQHRGARATEASETGATRISILGRSSHGRGGGHGEVVQRHQGLWLHRPRSGGKDIFVHASALERAGIMGLAEGQRVAVDVADGQKGPEAVSLRLI
jgi:cold shock CspA family protein